MSEFKVNDDFSFKRGNSMPWIRVFRRNKEDNIVRIENI